MGPPRKLDSNFSKGADLTMAMASGSKARVDPIVAIDRDGTRGRKKKVMEDSGLTVT